MGEQGHERVCFLVGPVGPPGSEVRRHADQLLRHVVRPAAEANGLCTVVRADQINSSGLISAEIVRNLVEADLVVADLSFGNPNAYYEVAVRHLLRRPFVHLIRRDEVLPFDVGMIRAVTFDLADLDAVDAARQDLESFMRTELERDPATIETPFSIAVDAGALQAKAEEDGDGSLARLVRGVSRIEESLRALGDEMREVRSAVSADPGRGAGKDPAAA